MGRRNRNKMNSDPIECIPFRVFTGAVSTGAGAFNLTTIQLTPAIDSRLSGIADYFQLYRFKKVRFTFHPSIPGPSVANTNGSVGYNPRIPNTVPASHTEIMTLTKSAYSGYGKSIDTRLDLPAKILLGDSPLNWYQTKAGTEADQFEVQGVLFVGVAQSTTTGSMQYTIDGICEFKSRSAAAQTPLRVQPKLTTAEPEGTLQSIPHEAFIPNSNLNLPNSDEFVDDKKQVWIRMGSVKELPWGVYADKECSIVGGIVYVKRSF